MSATREMLRAYTKYLGHLEGVLEFDKYALLTIGEAVHDVDKLIEEIECVEAMIQLLAAKVKADSGESPDNTVH